MTSRPVTDLERILERLHDVADRLEHIVFHRPPCPTCRGTRSLTNGDHCYENNGQCDGKVSIERLIKVFEAVHDSRITAGTASRSVRNTIGYLRGIQ